MLVRDIMDLSLEALPIVKLADGEHYLNEAAENFVEGGFILVVDEKGCLLGKINRYNLDQGTPAHKLRSLIEPVKDTILFNENAFELVSYFKEGNKGVVYVIDQEKKLIGAVSWKNRAVHMLSRIKDYAPFFPNIFDAMYEAIIIIDYTGTIIYVNHAYTNIVGVPAGKILGKKMEDIEPTSMCLKVLKGHPPVLNQKILIESIGVQVLANITPFYVNGKLQGVISVFRNIYETINLSDELKKMRDIAQYLHNELKSKDKLPRAFNALVGNNRYFREALVLAATVAPTDAVVMIRGESGVGKELLAEAIHKSSSRKNYPFIKVNCAAIPESLLESELFGYEEGAFTGAKKGGKPGKFELAQKGTIFLDEVGDMSPAMQAKLLRVIQEKEIEKIGGKKTVHVDVRIISATNKDLETMVVKKQFREDLYYRLNVIPIFLPPLKRRKDDIPLLVDYFLKLYCKKHNKGKMIVSSEVMNIFLKHEWPGNIRELKNVIEHAVILCSSDMITTKHLPWYLKNAQADDIKLPEWQKETLPELVEKLEKDVITRVLKKYGNKSSAIKALGISRRTFYLKLKKYQIDISNI
ncbi:sigma 54-interacting transcriptional regulator [Desulfofundulus thermosubterraneus]|uniref:PAS domain S-box-containing protein n=1 Tax=Desulfofundulus thermosubterraneus DSM 16057 TaxID=1121432 RepID=A0A1M6GRU4_9FIRM|nr:sigma 54-interacting transcriptional regulator [Desulfofundulus thermosubterraneus]SHJ12661.1 PAS domain S-box-containing protein [Desulfofundulus thermosubterraneus DSM 16057]